MKKGDILISKETGILRKYISDDVAYVNLECIDPKDHYRVRHVMGYPKYRFEEEFRAVTLVELKSKNHFGCECGGWAEGSHPFTESHSIWCKIYG